MVQKRRRAQRIQGKILVPRALARNVVRTFHNQHARHATFERWLDDGPNAVGSPSVSLDGNGDSHPFGDDDEPLAFDGLETGVEDRLRRGRSYRAAKQQQALVWQRVLPALTHAFLTRTPRPCDTSSCRQSWSEVLLITSDKAWTVSRLCCQCGSETSRLIVEGFFPSAPQRPRVAFSESLLLLFHHVLMKGPISKFAFARGLATTITVLTGTKIPDIRQLWNETYYQWLYMQEAVEKQTAVELLRLCEHNFARSLLCNECPACFFRTYAGTDGAAEEPCIVSIDGNFQHRRANWAGRAQEDSRTFDMFLSDNRIPAEVDLAEPKSLCGHSFIAGNQKPKPKSMINLDETGILGMTCRHGQSLRYQNLFAGERLSDSADFVQGCIDLFAASSRIYLFYDIACRFEPYLRTRRPALASRIHTHVVPGFHIYGHGFPCHVHYGGKYCDGSGHSASEISEWDWCDKRHLCSSGKISTREHRMALLHFQSHHRNTHRRRLLFQQLESRLAKAEQSINEAQFRLDTLAPSIIQTLPASSDSDVHPNVQELIRQQIQLRKHWKPEQTGPTLHPEIYAALMREATHLATQPYSQEIIAQIPEHERPFIVAYFQRQHDSHLARLQLDTDRLLLAKAMTRSDWGDASQLRSRHAYADTWRKLDNLMPKILEQFLNRKNEVRFLRNSTIGQKDAKKIVKALAGRIDTLKSLIEQFNRTAKTLPDPPHLELDGLATDVDGSHSFQTLLDLTARRFHCTGQPLHWALYPISTAIDIFSQLERAREEVRLVHVEHARLSAWVLEYGRAMRSLLPRETDFRNRYELESCVDAVLHLEEALKHERLLSAIHQIQIQELLSTLYQHLPRWGDGITAFRHNADGETRQALFPTEAQPNPTMDDNIPHLPSPDRDSRAIAPGHSLALEHQLTQEVEDLEADESLAAACHAILSLRSDDRPLGDDIIHGGSLGD